MTKCKYYSSEMEMTMMMRVFLYIVLTKPKPNISKVKFIQSHQQTTENIKMFGTI